MLKPADYTRWKRKRTWDLNEAVALMLGIEPHQKIQEDDQVFSDYWDMLDTVERSDGKDLPTTGRTHVNRYVAIYASARPADFLKWAKGKEYEIPEELLPVLEALEQLDQVEIPEAEKNLDTAEVLNKTEQRLLVIKRVILGLDYEPLAIPTGGKQKIMLACLKEPTLFTEPTFEAAWKEARKRDLVKMADHEKFILR